MRIRFKIGKGKGQDLDPIAELGLESADEFFTDQPDDDLELVGLDVAESDQAEAELEPVTFIGNEPDQPDQNLADLNVAESDQTEAELEPVTFIGNEPDQPDQNLAEPYVAQSDQTDAELEPFTFIGNEPDQPVLNLDDLNVAESDQAEAELEPAISFGDEPDQPDFILAEPYVAQSDQAEAELEPAISFSDQPDQPDQNLAGLYAAEFATEDPVGNTEFTIAAEAPDEASTGVDQTPIWQRIRIPHVRLPKFTSNKRIVTLTAEKDSFRVVVFKGSKVTAWGSTAFSTTSSPAAEAQSHSESEDSLSAEEVIESSLQRLVNDLSVSSDNRVWRLLGKVGVRRSRVVMDLSLNTTLMRNIQIPRVRGRYLEPVVLAEVLDSLPFGKDEVDISWRMQKEGETRSIFAVALPKKRLDSQVNIAKEVGLHPEAAYSKAVALALVSGVANGVVVHLEADETALVLVQSGEAKTVHQLEFGQAESTAEARANSVSRAIEQVASYYQPDNLNQINQPIPVILTGQCQEGNPMAQLLRSRLQREVLSIEPAVSYSEDFPIAEYAINLGLYLSDRVAITNSETSQSVKSSALNLLPKRHQLQPIPAFQTAVFLILALLMIQLYNVLDQVDTKIMDQAVLTQELQTLQELERESDSVLTTYETSRTSNEVTQERIDELEAQIDTLEQGLSSLLAQLRVITGPALPAGVTLSAIAPHGEDFTILGTAKSHAETLQYVFNLRDSGLFEDARMQSVEGRGGADPNSDGRVSFQIKVFHILEVEPDEEESTDG